MKHIVLIASWFLFANHFVSAWYNFVFHRRQQNSRRQGSQATPTKESIAPAVYRSDLYEILNVSRTSTVKEIRDAFMAIAVTSHPDRNNTQEALGKR